MRKMNCLPSGKRLHNYGKSPFLVGKSTISMAIFNGYVKLPEGIRFQKMGSWTHSGPFLVEFLSPNFSTDLRPDGLKLHAKLAHL